jgi:hypothetical protein
MRTDYILLDDDLEIMVIPHKPGEPKWLTYEEVDKLERTLSPKITRMLHFYNEMGAFVERVENENIRD